MSNARTLAAFLAGAVVALPGLALAQAPFETPPVETPPVEVPEPADPAEEQDEGDEDETPEVEELEAPDPEELEVEEQDEEDGEGNGEAVSALAECLPSGAELHGTGLTKGFFMRQAHTGEVMLGIDGEVVPLASPADAEEICAVVQGVADAAEAPETAKGRPDWAGPKGDEEPGARGRDRAAEAKADRGR